MQLGGYRIFLPFKDGAVSYHCVDCGSRCCKGEGFGATVNELVQLRRRYPGIEYFTKPRRDTRGVSSGMQNYVELSNYKPRCFFLRDDGQCVIHADHGRSSKPFVCRTFPTNSYYRSGDVIVIGLSLRLCPLRRYQSGSGDVRVHHAEVLADAAADIELIASSARSDRTRGSALLLDEHIIAQEEWYRDLEVEDFEALCAIFDLTAASTERQQPGAFAISQHQHQLDAYAQRLVRFLGVADWLPVPSPSIRADLVALSPEIRSFALRNYDWLSAVECRGLVGRLLYSLDVYARIALSASGSAMGLGGLYSMLSSAGGLFYLLTQIDMVPTIEAVPDDEWELPAFASPEGSAALKLMSLIYDENDAKSWPLDHIVADLDIAETWMRINTLQSVSMEALRRIRFTPSATQPCNS